MKTLSTAITVAGMLLAPLLLDGCLFVRETEHRIKLNDEGGGEAMVRLVDIRSDGETDSAVTADMNDLLASFQGEVLKEFERKGRKLVGKRLTVQGDTLNAEFQYTFGSLASVEGLMVSAQELAIIVSEEREIVRTNGSVQAWHRNATKISWPRDAERLMYRVRERVVPSSVLLGPKYRQLEWH
jgi:hypothetical protein